MYSRSGVRLTSWPGRKLAQTLLRSSAGSRYQWGVHPHIAGGTSLLLSCQQRVTEDAHPRRERKRAEIPTVALVGYTNAGGTCLMQPCQ